MSLAVSEKLKGIRAQITKTRANLTRLDADRKTVNYEISIQTDRLKQLNKELKAAEESKPTVSDHAVLRWMQRCMGIDIEAIREQILADGRREAIEAIGSGKVPISGEPAKLVVKSKTVVTVVGGEDA